MSGERLMAGEGTTETETHPGSNPENKARYSPPSLEEEERLEDLGNIQARERAAREAARAASSGGTRQPEAEITPEMPNIIDPNLSLEDLEYIAKIKAMPSEVILAMLNAKRAQEGKGPVPLLPPEISGIGQDNPERALAIQQLAEERRRAAMRRQMEEEEGIVESELTDENWMEKERYGQPLPPNEKYISVRILDTMGRQMFVYWPKDEVRATTRVRDVIGRIELAREDVDPQLSLEYQRIQAILGSIKANKELARTLGESYIKFNEELNLEFKGRRAFHQAFFTYETQSSIEAVVKSAVSLGPNDFNALFAIEEKISGTNKSFNPFVVALQFYEDHGHEFASNNSEEKRPEFGKKVLEHLADYKARASLGLLNVPQKNFTPEQKTKYEELLAAPNKDDYKWAQNLAERFFRFSGRAEMYDYLVVNKGKKDEQVVKFFDPDRHPITGEKITGEKIPVSWASDRDGCDYDITKIFRLRGFLRAEGGLRAHNKLLDGIDTFGGDILSRTVRASKDGINFIKYRITNDQRDAKIKAKVEDLMKKDKYSKEKAEEIALKSYEEIESKKYHIINEQNQLYADADSFTDRDDINNKGERVGRLDFNLLQRTKKIDGTGYEGFDFKSMGTTPLGLWVTRYVNGPEKLREALMGKTESYLNNPNLESLRALIDAFSFQKVPTHDSLKQLGINFILFARDEREGKTGKPKYDRTAIIAMVNDLTGLTDPNKPPFFNLEDRKEVLEKVFGTKHFDLIENIRFTGNWFWNFILGVGKEILKQGVSNIGK